MPVTFPKESGEYRRARNELLEHEIHLLRQMEAVSEARRQLPLGGKVPEDYVFDGLAEAGAPAKVRLSELFRERRGRLLIYGGFDDQDYIG